MNLIYLLIFGAVIGWLASMVMGEREGLVGDIILGIIGSFVGGIVVGLLGQPGITGFNLYSVIVGVIGAIVFIALGRRVLRMLR